MSEPVTVNVDVTHRRKSTEVFLDFQWKSIVQTVDVICKGIGFYFLILLAVVGAIYQAKISGTELRIMVLAVVAVAVAVSVGCGFLMWGVITGLHDVQLTLRSFNPEVFDEQRIDQYFHRARTAARAVAVACFAVLLVIIGALVALQYR